MDSKLKPSDLIWGLTCICICGLAGFLLSGHVNDVIQEKQATAWHKYMFVWLLDAPDGRVYNNTEIESNGVNAESIGFSRSLAVASIGKTNVSAILLNVVKLDD